MKFKIEENELFCLWNTEQILISETPKIASPHRINPNIFKYREFGESGAGLGHKHQ